MRYYAQYDNDKLIAIGTGLGGIEIAQEEYNTILAEIQAKARYVDKVYSGEITIEEVPAEWQEEVQRRVDAQRTMEEEILQEEISSDEVLDILLNG